jgi:hypothetical protein
MNSEAHVLDCQHPFGDGIHVVVLADADIIETIFTRMGINDQIKGEYLLLRKLSEESGKAACKCGAYQGTAPPSMVSCYAIVRMIVKPGDDFEFNVMLLLVENGYRKLGQMVAEQMQIALKNL